MGKSVPDLHQRTTCVSPPPPAPPYLKRGLQITAATILVLLAALTGALAWSAATVLKEISNG